MTAARALLAEPDAKGWTAGYAVELRHLAELLAPTPSYSTLRNYVRHLVKTGHLISVQQGIYALPAPRRPVSSTLTNPNFAACKSSVSSPLCSPVKRCG
jgi:hypothetical protein